MCAMGMDVAHGKTINNEDSYVALVSNYDDDFCHYHTVLHKQKLKRQELVSDVGKLVAEVRF